MLPAMTPLSVRKPWVADAILLCVAAVWGVTFPLAKLILEHLPPFTYLSIRFALAALLLLPLALREARSARGSGYGWALAAGVFLAAGYAFQTLGLRTAGASMAAFLTGMSVLLVPVLGGFFGRRTRLREWAAVGVATAGMALLTLRGIEPPGAGEALVLLCAVCFALQILALDRAAVALPPVALGTVQIAAVALLCAAFVPFETPPRAVPLSIVWAVAGMALVASALAFVAQSWAQRFTPPAHVGLVFAFEPVSAAVVGGLWLGERFLPAQWAGAALILAGIVLAESGTRRGDAAKS